MEIQILVMDAVKVVLLKKAMYVMEEHSQASILAYFALLKVNLPMMINTLVLLNVEME